MPSPISQKEQYKVAELLSQMRLMAMRKSGAKTSPKSRKQFIGFYRDIAKKSFAAGVAKQWWNGKKIRAGLFFLDDESVFYGVKIKSVVPDFAPGDRLAMRWVEKEISALKKKFHGKTVLFLPKAYLPLLPALRKLGFSVDSIILDGAPRTALRNLVNALNPPRDLRHLGLAIRSAKKTDIPRILRLSKREFSRNPRFGWFCSSKKFLESERKNLTKNFREKDHSFYVVEKGGKVFGFFGSNAKRGRDDAGITLLLDESIQGLGIAKTAYLILLSDMVRKRVKKFRGGTGQPAVMHLSKMMGRNMPTMVLRYMRNPFPKGHFDLYARP